MSINKIRNNPLINGTLTKSLRIVSRRSFWTGQKFFYVLNPKGKKLGKFQFLDDGTVQNLEIRKKFRKKAQGISALFAIQKFIKKQANKKGINVITFFADENNPNNVVRLYQKFATLISDEIMEFKWAINRKGKKEIKNILFLA